jgi:F-type H+-transporting ATPase subunit a
MLALPPLAAEQIFHIGSFPITNTLINGALATLGFAIFAFFLNLGMKKYYLSDTAPKGLVNFFESILEIFLVQIDSVTKDRKKTLKFLPVVGGIFLFVWVSNWLSQIPGTGTFGLWKAGELVPIFRPATSDLNLTLGMAVFVVALSHFLGVAAIGFFKYANKFIKLGDIWHAIKSGKVGNMALSLIEFFVGLLEIVSEVAKLLSLSLRLFGNIFAGEVLLTVMASLLAFFLPLPFLGLELLVGIVQAMVFALLTLVYLTIATMPVLEHGESHGMEMEV